MFDSEIRFLRTVHLGGENVLGLLARALLVVSLVFCACRSSGNSSTTVTESQQNQLHLEIPQASWEPIFFERIDELAKVANLSSLRSTALSGDDREARFWVEAGYFGMDGIVVRKTKGKWSGTYLHGFSKQPDFKKYAEQMQAPRSGWDIAWQQMVNAGLLTIPDASQVRCNVNGLDGNVFVVETNVDMTYRTYLYDNPAFAECEQAQQMIAIVKIINQEFGLQWPTTK